MEKGIPLVLAGYSPGQPEPERMLYEFSRDLICKTDWTPPEMATSGEFSADELGRFFNPGKYPAGTQFPRYLAPFHAWPYNQEEIMRKVSITGWSPPISMPTDPQQLPDQLASDVFRPALFRLQPLCT